MIENTRVPRMRRRSHASLLFALLIGGILLIAVSPASAQVCATPGKDGSPASPITGVVNTYYPGAASAAVNATSITLGAGTGASTAITSGDLLIVIQMQDASIDSTNGNTYGDGVSGAPGSGYTAANGVGRYEFVKATNGVPVSGGTLTLQGGGGSGLLNAYTNSAATGTQGQRRFQVVRVPQYLSVTLSSGLTALAWNGSTGGILSIDVAVTLSLNFSTVTVAGLGFRGGAGLRLQGSGGSNTDYRNTAPASAATLTGFHGSKGEGIAGTPHYVWNSATSAFVDTAVEGYPNGSMARGAPGNAGGGGTDGNPTANDENSGGGGGGNGGAGGVGGHTWNSDLARGGFGGVTFTEKLAGRVVMGGGGGAGTRNNSDLLVAASSGAAGGGIVIIRAGAITGFGAINASGAAAYNDTLNDGGGGGGAGGSVIVLALTGNLSGLTVTASGGRGGDAWRTQAPGATPGERHGPGGGGGGGVIFLSHAVASSNVTGGSNGITTTSNSAYGATAGAVGASSTGLTPAQIPGVQAGAQCPISPTEVGLISCNATRHGTRVLLEWQTGYEARNIGFNIHRETKAGLIKVTSEPVAGSALIFGPEVSLRAGFAYSWWDNNPPDDENTRYWIEDLDLSGHTAMRGPFFVNASDPNLKGPFSDKQPSPSLTAIGKDASALGLSAPVQRLAKTVKPTSALLTVQAAIASQQAVKLSVKQEGWYRVSQPDLLNAGFPANADPSKLQLFVDGQEVPITVTAGSVAKTGKGGTIGKGGKPAVADWDGIEFYGIGTDSPFTCTHVYWLTAGSQNGLRIQQIGPQAGSPVAPSFSYAVERRDKLVYFPSLKNGGGEKYFGPLVYNALAVDQSVTLQHVAQEAGFATLEVSLQGFTAVDHNVRVLFNGTELGALQFNGLSNGTAQYSVDQAFLLEGTNQIQFISPAGFSDISMVEYVRVTYQHSNTADSNAIRFPITGGQQATIDGFTSSSIRVVDATDPNSPQELTSTIAQGGTGYSVTVGVSGTGARTLMAFAVDQLRSPAALIPNQSSRWRSSGNAADYIAVTRKDLISSIQPLIEQRRRQGLKTAIVDVEDLYDEFSFGNKTPQALKDFFSYSKTSWKTAPRFALLAGDATYDPKDYFGLGDFDLVPTKLVETGFNETATDDWFVDVDGDDVPDIAIGRLPVRTPAEAGSLVAKIIRYDQYEGSDRVLLVADHNDGYDFEAGNTQLQTLIPASFRITDIRRGQVGDSNARSQLLDAINNGPKFVNFYGHGSTRLWTDGSILSAADAAGLVNVERLALFDSMTCLNGFFHDPTIESLGESLLKAEGGAIAVWASTGITNAGAQESMNQEAIRQLFSNTGLTIGEVTARAKAASSNADVRRTWVLLGDPATKIK